LSLISLGSIIWPRSSILTRASTRQQLDAIPGDSKQFSLLFTCLISFSLISEKSEYTDYSILSAIMGQDILS
jgi:hypothetical protein